TGRTVVQIRKEAKLRDALQAYLDNPATRPDPKSSPSRIRDDIKKHVQGLPEHRWACDEPPEQETVWSRFRGPIVLAALTLLVWALVPVLLPVAWWVAPAVTIGAVVLAAALVFVLALIVIRAEKRDLVDPILYQGVHVNTLVQEEDQIVQNQLTHLVNVKPGW